MRVKLLYHGVLVTFSTEINAWKKNYKAVYNNVLVIVTL